MVNTQIHIFKSGTHTTMAGKSITFSDAIVKEIADGYNQDNFNAPIVVGHPKDNTPAFGWVKGVSFKDGNLYADLDQVNPDFAELVKKGAYKKISASLYGPSSKNNPTPGKYYLKHVGFLGAAAPAVPGLKDVSFSDGDESLTIEFAEFEAPRSLVEIMRNLREFLISDKGLKDANEVIPEWMVQSIARAVDNQKDEPAVGFSESKGDDITPDANKINDGVEENKMTEEELKQAQAELEKKTAELEAEKSKIETDRDLAEAKAKVDGFVADGKVLPAESEALTQFMAGLDTNEISFSEGVKKSPVAFMEDFIKSLPKRTPNTGEDKHESNFAGNDGEAVARKAHKIVADSNGTISFSDAVMQVEVSS